MSSWISSVSAGAHKAGQKYIYQEGKSTADEWANQRLFDYDGRKLPAFEEYRIVG